jgi:hypothetical protein
MKAEHRHQLQTNALADRMGRLFQGMKSAPKSTSTLVWVFLFLVLATFAVWQYTASATMKDRSELWTRVDDATHSPTAGAGELQRIADNNPGTIPGRAAQFQLARSSLQQGLQAVTADDRNRAVPLLKKARDLYNAAAPSCVDVPVLAQEAMMGRATAEESLAGLLDTSDAGETAGADKSEQTKVEKHAGNLDQALVYYRELASKYPDSIFGREAAERVRKLDSARSEIDQFYAEVSARAAPPKAAIPPPGK